VYLAIICWSVLLLAPHLCIASSPLPPAVPLAKADRAKVDAIDWNAVREDASALLSRMVKIPSVTGQEGDAGAFLDQECRRRGLAVTRIDTDTGRPNVLATTGPQGPLKLLLLSHLDVVPAKPEGWTHPPFSGDRADGLVWGRGALDNKAATVIHLIALQLIKKVEPTFPLQMGLLSVSDEEDAGVGAVWVLKHGAAALGKATVIGEGGMGFTGTKPLPQGVTVYPIATSEKSQLWLKLTLELTSAGHGSAPPREYATRQLVLALERVVKANLPLQLTPEAKEMLATLARFEPFPVNMLMRRAHWPLIRCILERNVRNNRFMHAMLHDTMTVTGVDIGDVPTNVIATKVSARMDCRLLPGTKEEDFIERLKKTLEEPRIKVEVINRTPQAPATPRDEVYDAMMNALREGDPKAVVTPFIFPASSDANAFRVAGHPVFGFLPCVVEEGQIDSIHGANERVPEAALAEGVRRMMEIILRLRNWTPK
jgi:carboxypeptidase PM20D1